MMCIDADGDVESIEPRHLPYHHYVDGYHSHYGDDIGIVDRLSNSPLFPLIWLDRQLSSHLCFHLLKSKRLNIDQEDS